MSLYGTCGQGGRVWEWSESAFTHPNDSSSEERALGGGFWDSPDFFLSSLGRSGNGPSINQNIVGFRVASVPEPSAALLVLMGGAGWLVWRRQKVAL